MDLAHALRRYTAPAPALLLGLTVSILFVNGALTIHQDYVEFTRSVLGGASVLQMALYVLSMVVIEPLVLFGALYVAQTHRQPTVPLSKFAPALLVAAVVGTLVGQFVGRALWGGSPDGSAAALLGTNILLTPTFYGFRSWALTLDQLLTPFFVALSAVGFARLRIDH